MRVLLLSVASLFGATGQDYNAWDRTLKAHVHLGELDGIQVHTVDYAGLAADLDFTTFVSSLETATTEGLDRNQTYALFMNAYNALAMKMIIDHPCSGMVFGQCTPWSKPIKSITDIGVGIREVDTVWLLDAGKIGGKMYSLQAIENFLRKPEPFTEDSRLHACIVCASVSCPNVRMEAFRPERLDAQMDDQLRDMVGNELKGLKLHRESKELHLSKIFSWYAGDFEAEAGSVVDFLLPAIAEDDRAYIASNKDLSVKYFDYDWNANGPVPCPCTSDHTAALSV